MSVGIASIISHVLGQAVDEIGRNVIDDQITAREIDDQIEEIELLIEEYRDRLQAALDKAVPNE